MFCFSSVKFRQWQLPLARSVWRASKFKNENIAQWQARCLHLLQGPLCPGLFSPGAGQTRPGALGPFGKFLPGTHFCGFQCLTNLKGWNTFPQRLNPVGVVYRSVHGGSPPVGDADVGRSIERHAIKTKSSFQRWKVRFPFQHTPALLLPPSTCTPACGLKVQHIKLPLVLWPCDLGIWKPVQMRTCDCPFSQENFSTIQFQHWTREHCFRTIFCAPLPIVMFKEM